MTKPVRPDTATARPLTGPSRDIAGPDQAGWRSRRLAGQEYLPDRRRGSGLTQISAQRFADIARERQTISTASLATASTSSPSRTAPCQPTRTPWSPADRDSGTYRFSAAGDRPHPSPRPTNRRATNACEASGPASAEWRRRHLQLQQTRPACGDGLTYVVAHLRQALDAVGLCT